MVIKIVQTRNEASEYIGRGSPLGNPYPMEDASETERNRVCDLYHEWFHLQIENEEPAVLNELRRLYRIASKDGLSLGCYCAPKRCHGETIRDHLMKALMVDTLERFLP